MPLLHVAAVQAFRYKMKIASWNVNSIKARKEHVKKWLTENQPDLLMIQELKGVDFPTEEFEEIGYKSNAVTQKAYNGVAIFSKEKQDVISTRLYPDQEEEQARFIEIDYQGLRVINIYLPNGNPVSTDSEKYPYKLKWMDRLYERLNYQAGAWPQNKGIRIDHFLLPPTMVDKATNCWIDPTPRGWEKASDHTPIILEIDY